MTDDLLSQLKDIHLPDKVSVWPLTIGWYLLFIIFIALVGLMIFLWYKNIKKHHLKKIVLQRLNELQECTPNHAIAEELSMLLRRSALATFPRKQVASLHGEDWLNFLDKTADTDEFTKGAGRLLIVFPYQGKKQLIPEDLFLLIKDWVKKNL